MKINERINSKIDFDGFYVENIAEPSAQYRLFDEDLKESQSRQLDIFSNIEKHLPFFDGSNFKDQVHFQRAFQIPVQRWYPYREGYSIRLVDAFLKELNIKGNVFDPFAGSGTTLLASRINNIKSFGIDINPISTLVARVENNKYSSDDIDSLKNEISALNHLDENHDNIQIKFDLAEKIFNIDILRALVRIKNYINTIGNTKIRDVVFIAWLSIIESVSNVKKEGNGIKYKNRKRTTAGYINVKKEEWESKAFPRDKFSFVKNKLLIQLEIILADLKFSFGKIEKKPEIFLGSCLDFEKYFTNEFELTFFSPPYCNCFDYFEIHKVELWLGDFINNQEQLKSLRKTGFRSNTNSLDHKPIIYKNEYLENLLALLNVDKLWSNKIPQVVRGYFDDTYSLLKNLYHRTLPNGFVGIVVGNSAYTGVIIPTDILIANIAEETGFTVKNIFVVRHLTTSSQQKKDLNFLKNYLRESIVLLEKC